MSVGLYFVGCRGRGGGSVGEASQMAAELC